MKVLEKIQNKFIDGVYDESATNVLFSIKNGIGENPF